MAARERLITSAIALIRRVGVTGASVSALLEQAGLARRTLYVNFPGGKPELVEAAVDAASAELTAAIQSCVEAADPAQTLAAFTRMWEAMLAESDYTAGCPIVAATLGRSEVPAAADAAAAAFSTWEEMLSRLLRDAGLARSAAVDLATTAVAAVEGAVIMSVAQRSPDPLRRTNRVLSRLIRSQTKSDPPSTLTVAPVT
ncbi:TetR/AcrR family transcriptional regulator [Mycobacterium sp.]|uniref:TetR/AcrR family transcriptional regulator n=1 Tax=Mycobacterium sp. TaxID=1785 RepID=UPI0025EEE4C6|nr:TetR/AcrR family transcriptional regulator [Mycobacterium sp.]MBW0012950.1 TetR/AcrR family transcriptional regulator [Mycobacterium sp.]